MIMDLFTDGEYDQVDMIYNRFKNAGTQILTEEQLLPIQVDDMAAEPGTAPTWIIFSSLAKNTSCRS